MATSFFELHPIDPARGGGEWIQPTELARGPWDATACHAGPPTGMLIRASERLLPGQRFVRITVDVSRPIPFDGFRIAAVVTRSGRTVSTAELSVLDRSDRVVATARTLHMAVQSEGGVPNCSSETLRVEESIPGGFPIGRGRHGLPMFVDAVETRYPIGETAEPGPTTIWMRTVDLVADSGGGLSVSGFARIGPIADCGNAVSRNAEPWEYGFVNTDLTVAVAREPVGEWFGIRSVSWWEADGIGLSDSLLFDDRGPVGRAVQSLLIRRAG